MKREVTASLMVAMLTFVCGGKAKAATLEELKNEGWVVAQEGTVSDEFHGCDFDLPVPLDGGYIFVCREYNYHYSYRPTFLVLKRDSSTKYVIDDEEFDGGLYRGRAIYTYVSGVFEGCKKDKQIPLDNGLVFVCRSFRYHYAYHPKVVIVGNYISIGGRKYAGTLYER